MHPSRVPAVGPARPGLPSLGCSAALPGPASTELKLLTSTTEACLSCGLLFTAVPNLRHDI